MTKEAAFQRIYDETGQTVYRYLLIKCASPEDAADLMQETYLEIVRVLNKKGAAYIQNPEAFVRDTANKKLFAYYRKKGRTRTVPYPDGEEDFSGFPDLVSLSPEDETEKAALVEEIKARLSEKNETVRKIFLLYYSLDMKLEEIAAETGLPLSTVKSALYRTLKELRRIYAKERSE